MRISEILTESTEDVKGNIANVIHFQEIGGKLMYINEVIDSLSPLSSVTVLKIEDPSHQYEDLMKLVGQIEDKKIVLETSTFNRDLHNICDKVVFVFKLNDLIHENIIKHINNHLEIYIPLVEIDQEQFDAEKFAILCRILEQLYVRYNTDIPPDFKEDLQNSAKRNNTKLIEFEKIPLK